MNPRDTREWSPTPAVDPSVSTQITDADLLFAALDTYANKEDFRAAAGTSLAISGSMELHMGNVYVEIVERPFLMTDAKAKELVVDQVAKGRTLGMRPAFANRIRENLEVGEAVVASA